MSDSQEIVVRLFAGAREAAGVEQLVVQLPAPVTAGILLHALSEKAPQLRGLLPACRLAVNHEFVDDRCRVESADAVALIPPVSGG
jgi:molybdopterin converting factor subunit 1